jgi:hypothetical protein
MAIGNTLNNPLSNPTDQSPEDLINQGADAVYEDGSVDVNLGEDMNPMDGLDEMINESVEDAEDEFYSNLTSKLDGQRLHEIGRQVIEAFEADEASRKEWEDTLEQGFKNLGLKPEDVTTPFKGACGAYHPLIIENAVKFQSKASNELLPAKGPVKTQVLGKSDDDKESRATRIAKHLNWQTTTQMTEYYEDSERMLLAVPLLGSGFKKVYYNMSLKRNCSEFVSADQLVVPFGSADLERAPRYSQILYKSKDEYNRDVADGLYSDEDLGEPGEIQLTSLREKQNEILGISPSTNGFDYAYTFIEQHVLMNIKELDKGKLARPYIITVDKLSGMVVGIRRNWRQGDNTYTKRQYFVHYQFIPGFGFYGLGLIHLLGNYQMTLTAIVRSLVDAGQLSNLKGGFKGKAVRFEKDTKKPMEMGEWLDVETGGMPIKDALFPMQYGEPSAVLMQMMEYLESRGQKFADSTEQVVADSASYGPVGTTLALLDASAKFFSSLHKRLHKAQKKELQLLAQLNADNLEEMQELNLPGQTYQITREDYADVNISILPVSDPNIPSKAYLLSLTQNKIQFLQQVPQLAQHVNLKELLRRAFIAMDEENVDELIMQDPQAQPLDPVSDILAAINGQPIKAFQGQDHDSHIAVKTAWLQDPANGASPVMQQFAPSIQANIREHMIVKYQEQIGGFMQQQAQGQQDPKVIAMIQAQAAQQIMQANQNIQQQGSPDQILAQAEMLKAQNDVRKQSHVEQKDAAKLALEANKQRLEALKEDNRHIETLNNGQRAEEQHNLKVGADVLNKALDRVQQNSLEKFKAQHAKQNQRTN